MAASLEATNLPAMSSGMPDVASSFLRMMGALGFVLALLLGGAWFARNWQRLNGQRGRSTKLRVLEVRSLGNRQAVFVVGYEQQRLLLAASPAGITLIDRLPSAPPEEPEASPAPVGFAETLRRILPSR